MASHAFESADFTLRNVRRDFSEWHLGRPRYALWALDVDLAPLRQRVRAAQDHLGGLLLAHYRRQPHVTLSLCGFPSEAPCHADDFGAETLRAQLAALGQARPRPFDIEIGALASFTSAPYLTVSDEGGAIAALRACLADSYLQAGGCAYTPHVTVGLYADAWPVPAVQARLDSFVCGAPLRLRIAGINLMSYAAADIGGPLQRVARYEFDSAALRWEDMLFAPVPTSAEPCDLS